jgi:hypothetical protein
MELNVLRSERCTKRKYTDSEDCPNSSGPQARSKEKKKRF